MSKDRFDILQDAIEERVRSVAEASISERTPQLPPPSPEEVVADKIRMSRHDPQTPGKTIFLIGAGCSVTAGIPTVRGVAEEMIKTVAHRLCDSAGTTAEACYEVLRDERKIADCGTPVDWHLVYDELFRAYYTAPDDVRSLFSSLVENARGKINWAHLILGELVKHRYVSTVLTTNFDQLVLSGMVRAGVIPVVSDGIESLNRISGQPRHPQLIEIHGSRHTYQLRNQKDEVAEVARQPTAVAAVTALLQNATTFIVVGYGGREDGLMDLLIRAAEASPDKNLIWVSHSADPTALSTKARDFLNTGRNSLLLPGRDADTFFFNLAREIGIGSPSSLTDPLRLAAQWLDTVATSDGQDDIRNEIATARRRLEAAQNCMATIKEDVVSRARQLRLSGDLRAAWNLLNAPSAAKPEAARTKSPEALEEKVSIAHALSDRFAERGAEDFLVSHWRTQADAAMTADDRGNALNNLGNALRVLGTRERGTARLKEAVAAYRAALEEWTRERVPLDWAGAQNNLGTALRALGEREDSKARLREAVAAYRAALEELTRERMPQGWAMTQNNLGNALHALGKREGGTARLEAAVEAYRAALEERTRERRPLAWAMTQNNLGAALHTLGVRESGTGRLEAAVEAYRAALEERTRERAPILWAQTMENLAGAEAAWGDKTQDPPRWRAALAHVEAALEEYRRANAEYDIQTATHLRDHLLAKLPPTP